MNHRNTRSALIASARHIFAQYGYRGASVRAITAGAKANLGAVTYHFGSKRALYEAVVESATQPIRQRLIEAAQVPGGALDRVERVLRAFFNFLAENPDVPQLMLQQLVSTLPFARAALHTVEANVGLLASVIAEGQKDGSVRPGDPRLMALSIGAQPIWLSMARRVLQEGVSLDQSDPETRQKVVESVVRFVRAGLAAHPEGS